MATVAPALPAARAHPRPGAALLGPLLLLAAAFVLRWPHLGDPLYDLDEQWYLFVGARLRDGAVPYVDLWDRKPVGLFLLYALLAWPGHAVVAYQLGATAAAGATAIVVARLGEAVSDRMAGIAAGLAYLAWIETLGGGGGQSPVFYNLPVALAALATLQAIEAASAAAMRRAGIAAMLLVGVALQVKYTVVVEGSGFGLLLAATAWRRLPRWRWCGYVALLVAVALAPTLAALAWYAAIGHLDDFWYANARSIFARGAEAPSVVHTRLAGIALQFVGFVPCWLAGVSAPGRLDLAARRRLWLAFGWLAAAIGGFASIGTFFVHYGLPLFVPACVAAAPAFRSRPFGRLLAAALIVLPVAHLGWMRERQETAAHRAALARMVGLLPAAVQRRCLAVFDGPPMLYLATDACVLTRYAFPDHLLAAVETHAVGTDRTLELERLFARAPAAVAIADRPASADRASLRQIARHLAAEYRLVGATPWDERRVQLWVRR